MSSRLHRGAAIIAALVLPALSWIDGSGQLAWTMFSRTGQYRVTVVATDAGGGRRPVVTTALAALVGPHAGPRLAGADRWRTDEVARVALRRHLPAIAELACEAAPPGSVSVQVTLDDRWSLDSAVETRVARARCVR